MATTIQRLTLALSATLCATVTPAAELDLSTWQALTLDYAGGQVAGNWLLEPGNTAVKQVVNADPSFFLNGEVQGAYEINGSFEVQTGSDDDYIGFAFGYQNASNFYLFDWKQSSQSYAGQFAAEGMTLKRFTGATGDGLADLSLAEFWENEDNVGDMTVLATHHASTAGWVDNRVYNFSLAFNLTPGEFTVVVRDGETVLWDQTVADATFTSGQFAFYNNSQQNVRYAGFVQDVVPPPIPEPGTWALMLAGVGALALKRRRQHAG